jgi:O-antigen ligase
MDLSKIIKKLVLISPFFYPAYLLKFQIAGIPFTGLEIFVYLIFGLWIFHVVSDRTAIVWDKTTKWYWYAAFAIAVGAALGVIFAPNFISLPSGETLDAKRTALGVWKGWVFAPAIYFALLTQVLKTKDDVKNVLRSFVYSAALVGIISDVFGLFGEGVTTDMRLRGFFESANYLALYLVPAILMNIYFFLTRPKSLRFYDKLDLASLAILAYCLFFTQSYAGIIGVFGALGIAALYHLLKNPKQRKKIIIALVVLGATFAVILVTQLNSPKFKQSLDYKNRSSTSVRLEIYRTSWDLIKKSPLVGIGPGLFQANYQNQAPITLGHAPLEWNMPHPHNIFLAFWLNAGIIGLAGFIFILILAHRRFTFPLIALWGILIHGMFDMPFWKNDLAMIFWLVIACILILQKTKKSE